MTSRLYFSLKLMLLAMLTTVMALPANAVTYTAVASGDWTSSATWQGGLTPGTTINGDDDIIIGTGIVVNMDADVTLNGATTLIFGGSIIVDGTLTSSNNSTLYMNNGDLDGSGTISIERISFSGLSTLGLSGSLSANCMESSNATLVLGTSITVNDTLFLENGAMSIATSALVNLQNDATIVVEDGSLGSSGGLLSATGTFNTLYVGSSKNTGIEASTSGLRNLTIDLDDNTQSVTLTNDVAATGTISLNSGNIDLNGNNLSIMGDYVALAGTSLEGDANSSILVAGSSTISSPLEFMSGAEAVNNFEIDYASMGDVTLASDLIVNGELILTNGNLNLDNNSTLTMESNTGITINNGELVVIDGSFDGSASYDITYYDMASETGLEISGSGVNDVTINLGSSSNSVMLSSDMEADGNLTLTTGMIDLNGFDLTVMGDFMASNTSAIMGDANSSLAFMTSGSLSNSLEFASGAEELSMLQLNFSSAGSATIATNLTINNALDISQGSLMVDGGSTLTVASGTAITLDNGNVMLSNGSFDGSADYTVTFSGMSSVTGAEVSGSGMTMLTVNLDNASERVELSNDLETNADIDVQSGTMALAGNNLSIMGDLMLASGASLEGDAMSDLEIASDAALSSGLMFESGSEMLNNLTVSFGTMDDLALMSDLSVSGMIVLNNGNVNIDNGSTITMEAGSSVEVENGSVVAVDGMFDGSASYDVNYSGQSTTTGVEASGSGLSSLTVNLDDGNGMVTLSDDVTVNTMLNMNSGHVVLNENMLRLEGDYISSGSAMLVGDAMASVVVSSATSTTNAIEFESSSNMLSEFVVDIDDGGSVALGSDVETNTLTLSNGTVVITDNNLSIASGGSIDGGSSDSYVQIDGNGGLSVMVNGSGAGYVEFPVGTDEGYAPASILLNAAGMSEFTVNTANGVMTNGTSGADISASQSIVSRTWNVSSAAGSSTDIDLMVAWSSDMEVNAFDGDFAYISHYTSGSWDATATTSATLNADGMYELERTGIMSLGPFAVFDESTSVGIDNIDLVQTAIYPNPAQNMLFVELPQGDRTTLELIDLNGKIFKREVANGTNRHGFDISDVPSGVYMLRVATDNGIATERIVKS